MLRLYKAFLYSMSGLASTWRSEPAFRMEAILAAIMIPAAPFISSNAIQAILMIGSVLLVLALELVNSAIEAAIDRIGKELHPLSKKAKDAASAAVFIALINAGMVWGICIFC